MKQLIFLMALSIYTSAHAASEIQGNMENIMKKNDGIQLSLNKSFLSAKVTEANVPIESESESFNDVLGLSVGYINAPMRSLGYMGSIQIDQITEDGETLNFYSVYADGVFAVTSNIITYAGLNISKLEEANTDLSISPGIGLQVGAEYKLTDNFSLRGRYILRNNTLKYTSTINDFNLEVNAQISGLELGLVGTF